MAVFETWLQSDLKKPVKVKQLQGNMFSADNGGNLIGVEVTDEGSPASLSGSAYGYVIRADGATVVVEGTLSENKASITLPTSCYVVVGEISIVIKVGTTTVGACVGYVYRSTTDTIVDPGSVVPSLAELLAKIADCEAATTAANNAAANANAKAGLANDAAALANAKAGLANTAAENADNKATLANNAAVKIDNMTATASGLPAGASPTVSVTEDETDHHKIVTFGIPKGDKGDRGKDFHIQKTFVSIAAMQAYDPTQDQSASKMSAYDFCMIDTGSVEDVDTGKLYCYEPDQSTVWHYIGDLSGKQGIKGETGTGIDHVTLNADYTLTVYYDDGTSDTTTSIRGATGATPNIAIGTVTTLQPNQPATVALNQTSTPEAPVFDFGIPRGMSGNDDIDDTAGIGDTDKVWSANKAASEIKNFMDALKKIGLAVVDGQFYIDPVTEI